MSRPFLSVIIPAYNEARRLPLTIVDVEQHLKQYDFSYEIIVAMSPGTDESPALLGRLASALPHLNILALKKNLGKGYAVRMGMLAAKGSWRLFMDADNSTSIAEFAKMLPYLMKSGKGFEVLIGSRRLIGSHRDPLPPMYRRVLSALGGFFIRLFLVPGVSDTQCGFKCFSAGAAEKIFDKIRTDGWSFDIETLALARRFGYQIKEIPVFWSHDARSRLTAKSYFQIAGDTLMIGWRLFMGSYKLSKRTRA